MFSKDRHEFYVKHKAKNGELRDVQVITRVLDLYGYKIIQASWRDITERRRSEEALHKCREQLEALTIEHNRGTDGERRDRIAHGHQGT